MTEVNYLWGNTDESDALSTCRSMRLHPNWLCSQPAASYWQKEREREIALVHSASLAYEDGSVFMSMAMGQIRYKSDQINHTDNTKAPMRQHENHGENQGGLWL